MRNGSGREALIVIGLLVISAAPSWAEPLAECQTIEACVRLARDAARPAEASYRSLNDTERQIADRLKSFGPSAVPALIELLNDRNPDASEIAGYALRDIESIDPQYLPDLNRAMRRGDGWIPPAIGRIPTDEAARLLVDQLFRVPETQNQLTYALRLAGPRAVPFLVKRAHCETPCLEYISAIHYVLKEIGAPASSAVPSLLNNARDSSLSFDVREGNVRLIGAIGPGAGSADLELVRLAENEPALRQAVFEALFGIASPRVVPMLREKLASEPSVLLLRDISAVGPPLHAIGPTLVSLLSHEDWEIRVNAIRALGYVRYDATNELVPYLESVEDWRRAWAAAQSLGRIGNRSVVPALERTAEMHWYGPVREEAEKAIRVIRGQDEYEILDPHDNFAFRYFSELTRASQAVNSNCQFEYSRRRNEPEDQKLYAEHAKSDLEALAYPVPIDPERRPVQYTPVAALKVSNGWLLAGDRGEWGGETVFRDAMGNLEFLLRENTADVYAFSDAFVSVTGLAHLGFNYGRLYRLSRSPNGAWHVSPWRQLPGAPYSSWILETGELFVKSFGGTHVIVGRDGSLRTGCK